MVGRAWFRDVDQLEKPVFHGAGPLVLSYSRRILLYLLSMRITSKGIIAGMPALQARHYLKKMGTSGRAEWWLARNAKVAPKEAYKHLRALAKHGLSEVVEENGVRYWTATMEGRRVALASAALPLSRDTAKKKLREFLDRVRTVEKNDEFVYRVKRAIVFGSYLSDAQKLSDIDIAVELVPRYSGDEFRLRHSRSIKAAEKRGRAFRDWFEGLCWPQNEVFLFLKSRSRSLSLHGIEDPAWSASKHKVIYSKG